jgi:hypothetical protein
MEMYGKIKCVTFDELVPAIISKPNYDKHVKLNKFTFVRRGGNGRKALIVYESLPSRIRQRYDETYPDAEQEMKEKFNELLANDMIRPDSAAVEYFRKTYKLLSGKEIKDTLQDKYILNAQVMNELIRVEGSTRAIHTKSGYCHSDIVWNIVLDTCERLYKTFDHTLPRSKDRLKRVMQKYKKEGYIALVSGKVGNQNTRRIGIREGRLLLKLRRSKFPVYTEEQIFKEYNRRAKESGLNQLKSENSVRNFLFEPSVMPLWYASVYGELAFQQKYISQLKTELPMMRDALWYSDGTKLNLYYKGYENGKAKMCTTSVYEVMDAYSEVFLGYDISQKENFTSQYRAFRMAVGKAGVKPYEIVTDNQGGHKRLAAKGFFKKICTLHRTTIPHHGQSKTIESAFGRMQAQILHKIWHFTGMNITTKKKNSRPNMELIEANVDKLPTLEEMKALYAECRREWNESAHPSSGLARIDMYRESSNPYTAPVTELDMIRMFWLPSDKPVTYTSQGIKLTLNKQTYEYDVYDADGLRDDAFALKHTGRQFYIMYDPFDMTLVELWKPVVGGMERVMQVTPRVVTPRGTLGRSSDQTSWMRKQLEKNRALRASMVIALEDFDIAQGIAAEFNGLVTPDPAGIGKRAMEAYRDDYTRGRLKAPVHSPYLHDDVDVRESEPQSVGQWEKAVSNMTFDEAALYENRF